VIYQALEGRLWISDDGELMEIREGGWYREPDPAASSRRSHPCSWRWTTTWISGAPVVAVCRGRLVTLNDAQAKGAERS